jgi:hypothetical protein
MFDDMTIEEESKAGYPPSVAGNCGGRAAEGGVNWRKTLFVSFFAPCFYSIDDDYLRCII